MSKFLAALKGENRGRPPVWLMRQAGRYLPEYRELRKAHSLSKLFHEPELAAEVTLQPLRRFALDAAIVFSDILLISEALGFQVHYPEGQKPYVDTTRKEARTLDYVEKTIHLLKKELRVPLIGFCGGPFTVSCYFENRTDRFLEELTRASIDYLHMQIDAGASAIQIFDSWAGTLSLEEFRDLSLRYLAPLVDAVKKRNVPVIVFCRGASQYVEELVTLKPTAISFDWKDDISVLRQRTPSSIAVQGNLSPHVLLGSQEEVKSEAEKILSAMKGEPGFIFNLGHGVLPATPVENVQCLIETIAQTD